MASARKCDVCEKLYESYPCTPWVNIFVDNYPYGDNRLDLCPDCQKKLEEFIHFKKTPIMEQCEKAIHKIK